MLRCEIKSVIDELGEEFDFAGKTFFGHFVRCGQKIPSKLKMDAAFMAGNAYFATLLATDEISPAVGEEVLDKNGVSWLIDAINPLYHKGEVQGYFLLLRTNQGIVA